MNQGTGALDSSNRNLAGTAGIHDRAEINPSKMNEELGVQSDYGTVGMHSESTQPNMFEKGYPQDQKSGERTINTDQLTDSDNVKTVTVLGGQGLSGTAVEGDVRSNFGGFSYEVRK